MTAPADKQYNELAARLARLETLLESNDAYAPPGAVTLDDLDLGPALTFDVPTYDQYLQQATEPDIQWDPESYGFDSAQYADWQDQLQGENFGYGPSDSGIDAILARLANIETFLSGGSNDTNQSVALDAGQSVDGDGITGTGVASPGTDAAASSSSVCFALSGGGANMTVATETFVTGNTDIDTASGWSTDTYTVQSAGYYSVRATACGVIAAVLTGITTLRIRQAGSATVVRDTINTFGGAVNYQASVQWSTVLSCSVGDTIRLSYFSSVAGRGIDVAFINVSIIKE